MSTHDKFTPGPWRWAGEDYRGGWGWQLLVNASGEGVLCGEGKDGPYKRLRAFMPIAPELCKTGMYADDESAPCVHVRQADANLIAAAPDLYWALSGLVGMCALLLANDLPANVREALESNHLIIEAKNALARAEGRL